MQRHVLIYSVFLILFVAVPFACRYQSEIAENEKDEEFDSTATRKPPVILQPAPQPKSPAANQRRTCDVYTDYDRDLYVCYATESSTYLSNCGTDLCKEVNVMVSYLLTEDLGAGHTVVVEAFDNHLFKGNPQSVLRLANFDASRPGTRAEDSLLLSPGEYYLRAYIATNEEPILPYQYGDMELVTDKPLGVYGALSEVSKVVVAPTSAPPVSLHIVLDKLFQKPDSQPPTHAHLRAIITLDPSFVVPRGQELVIQLHEQEDFAFHPVYRFKVASENLLVSGSEGRTEFYSDQLDIGKYFVFVYLDVSGNGFYDEGEPQQTYIKFGEKGLINIERDKTVTIPLQLSTDPATM